MEKENKNEKTNEEEDKHHVETFLGGMPLLGGFFNELGKTDVFKERFKEVNKKIEENLKKGGEKNWVVESRLSVRPMQPTRGGETKEGTTNVGIGEDYLYEKKQNKLTLLIKVPKEEVNLSIQGKDLLITSDNFEKRIELPDYFKWFQKKQYKDGALMVELTK